MATGEIQWDYPNTELSNGKTTTTTNQEIGETNDHHGGEDEMDICTTPPPNVEEQLMEEPLAKKLRQKDSKGTFYLHLFFFFLNKILYCLFSLMN